MLERWVAYSRQANSAQRLWPRKLPWFNPEMSGCVKSTKNWKGVSICCSKYIDIAWTQWSKLWSIEMRFNVFGRIVWPASRFYQSIIPWWHRLQRRFRYPDLFGEWAVGSFLPLGHYGCVLSPFRSFFATDVLGNSANKKLLVVTAPVLCACKGWLALHKTRYVASKHQCKVR